MPGSHNGRTWCFFFIFFFRVHLSLRICDFRVVAFLWFAFLFFVLFFLLYTPHIFLYVLFMYLDLLLAFSIYAVLCQIEAASPRLFFYFDLVSFVEIRFISALFLRLLVVLFCSAQFAQQPCSAFLILCRALLWAF